MGVLLKDEQLIDDALNQYYWHIKYLQDPEKMCIRDRAMAVPAFAETTTTTYTITIKNGTGTYAAYQIFKGDLHDNTLSNRCV